MKLETIEPQFVEYVPATLAEGVLYVSMTYKTTVHLCACGCGNKVVLPLSPAEWRLSYDGEVVSLRPSVGNWEFSCQSHYWIDSNRIHWAAAWTKKQIAAGRQRDTADLDSYLAGSPSETASEESAPDRGQGRGPGRGRRVRRWLRL